MSKLSRELMPTGASVAVIGHPLGAGSIAHQQVARERESFRPGFGKVQQTYYVAACAASEKHADEAYLVTAAWADHMGADACPEQDCFPDA